ncbi:MAG TPA: hypothetical protein VGI63_10050 [Verrucomicrobiae bacterium]
MIAIAIIGASSDCGKFGNKAVRAFMRQGFRIAGCGISIGVARVEQVAFGVVRAPPRQIAGRWWQTSRATQKRVLNF